MQRTRALSHNRNFPIIVILLLGILLGLMIFQDFGASYDEPSYYFFGSITLKAYANPLGGVIQSFYRHYGQPFFVIGDGIHSLFLFVFPHALSIDLWHLLIYFSFLLEVFFFYKLAQRWVSTTAATISALLFASQPVLFGLSWFDPKDVPFTVFFLGAIYLGLVFSDQAGLVFKDRTPPQQKQENLPAPRRGIRTKREKAAVTLDVFLCALSLLLVIAASAIRKLIANTILSVDINHPTRFIDQLFVKYAHNAQNLPLISYANKFTTIFNHALILFLAITFLCLAVTIYFWFQPFFNEQIHILRLLPGEFIKNYAEAPRKKALLFSFMGACLLLGLASSTRTVGPFAALLVMGVWVVNLKKKSIPVIVLYGLLSFIIFLLCWPYLWQNTLENIIQSVRNTTNFSQPHIVLFGGRFYDSRALPASYLPTLLAITLTEPAVLFILAGMIVAVYRFIKKEICRSEILVPFVWFFLPFFYVVITTPNIYDNYRQLLFIIPGLFLFSALSIDFIFKKIRRPWINGLLIIAILFPGPLASIQLHPYEYAYYNSIVGGMRGAAHKYEVDPWLTCYKALTQQINANEKGPVNIYVDSNPGLVQLYANENLTVGVPGNIIYPIGSLIVLPMRYNHESLFPEYPIAYAVKRSGVSLCEAKRVK